MKPEFQREFLREVQGIRAELAAALGEAGPSDEELLGIAAAEIEPYDRILLGEYEPENNCALEVYGSELIAFARAVLARWGRPAQPAPPVEGEQALQVLLTVGADCAEGARLSTEQCRLAAELLAQSTPPAPPAEGETAELSPKEIEARDAFTAMRDEILHGLDGFAPDQTNAVLDVIDNHTPEWVCRYELLGPLEGNWEETCLVAALRTRADHIRAAILAIAIATDLETTNELC